MLVADENGVHFTPVIAVDLHKMSSTQKIVCIETENGNSISLTRDHMVIVHSKEEKNLVPAGDIKPGMHVEVVGENLSGKG